MKKALMAFGIVLSIMIATVAALLLSLQSSYRVDIANSILKRATTYPITIEDIAYNAPYQLSLSGVQLGQDKLLYIDQITLWLSSDTFKARSWVLDSILIDGLNLQQAKPSLLSASALLNKHNILLHQLAFNNLDFAHEGASPNETFSARSLNLQITDPTWESEQQVFPYGKLQLSAEQIYWQDEAIDNLLIDVDYKPKDSTAYGISFSWRDAQISGQAEQFDQAWSLINVTIDGLRLNEQQAKNIITKDWSLSAFKINHLNSVDILRSDVKWQDGHFAGFDISLENIQLPFKQWQQNKGSISIQANSLTLGQHIWVEPSVKLSLMPGHIILDDLFTQWLQGSIQLSGAITPDSMRLNQLSIQGVKWFKEEAQNQVLPSFINSEWLSDLKDLSINELNIERSQFIQLAQHPYWQVSGFNVEGQQLTIIKNRKLGLWQGQLRASANNASYQSIVSSHPLLEMNSNQGVWQLTRFFAPLERGYMDAHSTFDFSKPSQPWTLSLTADGLPITPFTNLLALPFEVTGLSEFELQASGLGGDLLMFNHTLDGQITGSIRNGELVFPATQPQIDQPRIENANFEIPELAINVDRGRLELSPAEISGKNWNGDIRGKLDLSQVQESTLFMSLSNECARYSGKPNDIKFSQDKHCQQSKNADQPHSTQLSATQLNATQPE